VVDKKEQVQFSVFTKPWKTQPLAELGKRVKAWGFDGIELPVRPGFQVEPHDVAKGLPAAAKILADCGLKIYSVAGPTDEATLAACAELSIPTVRIMVGIEAEGYLATEAKFKRETASLLPLLEKYGMQVGVQNHCGRMVCHALGLLRLMETFPAKHVGAIWDCAHNALNGEEPEVAVDIIWSHLCMVNFKNAFWKRKEGTEATVATWSPYWTNGRHGLASWPRVAAELKKRQYQGVICLTAEYTEEAQVDHLIAEDIVFAKSLFTEVG